MESVYSKVGYKEWRLQKDKNKYDSLGTYIEYHAGHQAGISMIIVRLRVRPAMTEKSCERDQS
jgi:hypothetical protein